MTKLQLCLLSNHVSSASFALVSLQAESHVQTHACREHANALLICTKMKLFTALCVFIVTQCTVVKISGD